MGVFLQKGEWGREKGGGEDELRVFGVGDGSWKHRKGFKWSAMFFESQRRLERRGQKRR